MKTYDVMTCQVFCQELDTCMICLSSLEMELE